MKTVEVSVTTSLVRWPTLQWVCPECGHENLSLCHPSEWEEVPESLYEAEDHMTCEKCEGQFLPEEEPEIFQPNPIKAPERG